MQALRGYRRNKASLIAAVLIALIGHVVGFSGIWFLFQALAGGITFVEVLTLQPLVALVRLISITPHGLGIADAVGDVAYHSVGSAIGAEVVFVSRLVTMSASALCGISFVFPFTSVPRRSD